MAAHKEHTLKNLAYQGSGAFGNAATRLGAFAYSKGRTRGSKTRRLMRGMSSRRRSATAEARSPVAPDPAEAL